VAEFGSESDRLSGKKWTTLAAKVTEFGGESINFWEKSIHLGQAARSFLNPWKKTGLEASAILAK